jgi:hypothetical protein
MGNSQAGTAEPPSRCEMCQVLACARAVGVQQLLQASMWVDRAFRFSEPAVIAAAIAKVDDLRREVSQTG